MLFLVFRQKYYVTGARDYQSRSNALMLIKWETLRTVEPRFPAVQLRELTGLLRCWPALASCRGWYASYVGVRVVGIGRLNSTEQKAAASDGY